MYIAYKQKHNHFLFPSLPLPYFLILSFSISFSPSLFLTHTRTKGICTPTAQMKVQPHLCIYAQINSFVYLFSDYSKSISVSLNQLQNLRELLLPFLGILLLSINLQSFRCTVSENWTQVLNYTTAYFSKGRKGTH